MLPARVTKYLSSRGIKGPWRISGNPGNGFSGAVVIPALAESARLFHTLRSLAENPPEALSRFLMLMVVNHREDAPDEDKADNLKTLKLLSSAGHEFPGLCLAWVDAASPGMELPAKKGGVGLARKIGFDLALPLLDSGCANPLLVALDSDTLVQPDYLSAIIDHFSSVPEGGAVIPFRHQEGKTGMESDAITRYELFLRSYVLGLSLAGSPYAFHTVGSAMACTARSYIRIGGMNTRIAAEDFYFLQHLKKTAGISQVNGTCVHPSARASHRVPFGTGRSISRILSGEHEAVLFYQVDCFKILSAWISLVGNRMDATGIQIGNDARKISSCLGNFLDNARFPETWEKLKTNSSGQEGLRTAFHGWFDGLQTMKLIHHLSDTLYPRVHAEESLMSLLEWAGLEPVGSPEEQLALLRSIQQ
ncbi:MAG: hypothetical protein VB050_09240 [Geobacteraceae bacterium]|nr:hypothetical protein [Geobacteraceae bacterium]